MNTGSATADWFAENYDSGIKVLQAVIDRIMPYFESYNKDDVPVVKLRTAEQIKDIMKLQTDKEGIDSQTMIGMIDQILDLQVRTQHKHFNNQLFGQSTPEGLAGEI